MEKATFTAFSNELQKIGFDLRLGDLNNPNVHPMISHWEVTLDENGKATGLSDVIEHLAGKPGGLRTVRVQADDDLEKLSEPMDAESDYNVRKPLPGGLAAKAKRKLTDFNPKQLEKGMKTEMREHGVPKHTAESIANHLTENPKEYTKKEKLSVASRIALAYSRT